MYITIRDKQGDINFQVPWSSALHTVGGKPAQVDLWEMIGYCYKDSIADPLEIDLGGIDLSSPDFSVPPQRRPAKKTSTAFAARVEEVRQIDGELFAFCHLADSADHPAVCRYVKKLRAA